MATAKEYCDEADWEKYEFTSKDKKHLQVRFAETAFRFIRKNSNIWITHPTDFLSLHEFKTCYGTFTEDVGKSVVIIGFCLQLYYKKVTRVMFHTIKNEKDFENYLSSYKIPRTESYFYNILAWVSFLFDFCVRRLKDGHDYLHIGQRVLAKYQDVEYFHERGGWGRFLQFSSFMAALYDRTVRQLIDNKPVDIVLCSFIKALEALERFNRRYTPDGTAHPPVLRHLAIVQRTLCYDKSGSVKVNPNKVSSAYKVLLDRSPARRRDTSTNIGRCSTQPESGKICSENTLIDKTELYGDPVQISPKKDGAKPSVSSPSKEKIPIFLVSEKFFENMIAKTLSPTHKRRRALQIYSPTKKANSLSTDMNEVLEEYVAKKNYCKVSEGIFAIKPHECDIDDDNVKIIVMDDGDVSEDEIEEEAIKAGRKVIEWVKSVYYEERGQQDVEAQVSTQLLTEVLSDDAESPQRALFVPTRDTGAIPKIRVEPTEQMEPASGSSSEWSTDESAVLSPNDI